MNNRGQTVFMSIIFAIMIFMIGMLVVNFFKDEITTARVGLECSDSANISDGNKLMCLYVGLTLPLFILMILSVVGGILASRFLT